MLYKEALHKIAEGLGPDALALARKNLKQSEGLVQRMPQKDGGYRTVVRSSMPGRRGTFPIYDDRNPRRNWQPDDDLSYDQWLQTVKGTPTIYYGNAYDSLTRNQQSTYMNSKGIATEAVLDGYLDDAIQSHIGPAMKRHKFIETMTPAEQAGLAPFYYNMGPGARNKLSVEAALAKGDRAALIKAMNQFVYANGKVNKGLVARRKRETAPIQAELDRRTAQAKTQQPTATVQQPKQAQTYTVRKGDTIYGLWKKSGRKLSWPEYQKYISKNNPGVDLSRLSIGQTLKGI